MSVGWQSSADSRVRNALSTCSSQRKFELRTALDTYHQPSCIVSLYLEPSISVIPGTVMPLNIVETSSSVEAAVVAMVGSSSNGASAAHRASRAANAHVSRSDRIALQGPLARTSPAVSPLYKEDSLASIGYSGRMELTECQAVAERVRWAKSNGRRRKMELGEKSCLLDYCCGGNECESGGRSGFLTLKVRGAVRTSLSEVIAEAAPKKCRSSLNTQPKVTYPCLGKCSTVWKLDVDELDIGLKLPGRSNRALTTAP